MDKVVKLKRFRPAFERGTVSEHQFLELQAETHRLKKEIANRDDQHKMLVVKLHRAQEAAKKNLRATVEQALVVSKDKNAVMAMFLQQNNAEEKIQELELKLREGHRDAKKYLEHSRESKAEAESLRKRLEGTVRASRRTRPPTPLDVSRRYEKMVKKLKMQLMILQEENKELRNRTIDQLTDGPDCSKSPSDARLEIVSHVVRPTSSQTKRSGRHKQQDDQNDHMAEAGTNGACIAVMQSPPKKLQDTYSELNQERKLRLELEIEKKQISGELIAAEHLRSNLQQLRHQNLQLENENAELLNAALNVPRTNFAEIKSLREQLVEELKQRNLAVANVTKLTTQLEDCKRDLARLAVVEANWQYLKTELEVANKSVATGKLQMAELQVAHKLLQKKVKVLESRQAEIPEELEVIYEPEDDR
ncbi:hypothetical protein Mp_2g22530 [Marchantia polymorpha subsp. ruderalis]|uniref:Uncharacterized protein n=1 Tax=Marchantia polymorpha TaxID=3197 RepID=A0A2R6WNB2_MARPO|nr:hypothetical protein MARPO_0072s0078 [Marchantia polymorpha]BBN03314.1 hypothetical protein Mp_2g22530 [Marchantia polymorpha subsp. ruderalis]|eukprot:PTQ35337.1 hypothetical protein MARPO_0072s0078 [Marchantia polymorpha]